MRLRSSYFTYTRRSTVKNELNVDWITTTSIILQSLHVQPVCSILHHGYDFISIKEYENNTLDRTSLPFVCYEVEKRLTDENKYFKTSIKS